jgi:hypothetical protein
MRKVKRTNLVKYISLGSDDRAAGRLQGQRTTIESWTPELNSTQARNQETPKNPEPVFLNVYGAQESIPRNEFRQPM